MYKILNLFSYFIIWEAGIFSSNFPKFERIDITLKFNLFYKFVGLTGNCTSSSYIDMMKKTQRPVQFI